MLGLAVLIAQPLGAADLDRSVMVESWRFAAETSTRAARFDLDDTEWREVSSLTGPVDFEGVGWFRSRFSTQPDVDRRLVVLVTNVSPIEIWIDGDRQYASTSAHFPIWAHPIVLGPGDRHVIAVRVENLDWTRMRDMGFLGGFRLSLSSVEPGLRRAAEIRDTSLGAHAIFIGISAALAVVFLLLYAFNPDERARLYFAAINLANVGIELCTTLFIRVEDPAAFPWISALITLSVVGMSISLMFVVRSLFFEVPRWYRLYVAAGVAVACSTWILPLSILYFYSLTGILEGLRTLVIAMRHRKPGSALIGAGFLVVFAGVALQAAHDLQGIDYDESIAAAVGLLGLLAAMCVKLAMDFAASQRRRVAAETERVRLEDENLRKAQALEEAQKLEEAHRALEAKHRELVDTQSYLIQAEKMASLGRWVAGVAHEMNTPLGAMASARDSISRAKDKIATMDAGDPKLVRALDVIGESAGVIEKGTVRIAEIVDRLRSFARLDEAEVQRVHLHACVRDALALSVDDAGDRIEVVQTLSHDLPEILVKPGEINQVLYNVLLNAKQAIAERGRITVETRREGSDAVVTVTDDGCGIPREALPRVFDPGFTARGGRVGVGLGLAIAYRIVEAHRGKIEIDSEVGRGTRVTVRLPINA
jgi:signal transduction histidine kinase